MTSSDESLSKCGIILAVHNRIDDLLANLDILKFYPEVEKIIVCSRPLPDYHRQELSDYRVKFIDGKNRGLGPLLSLTNGLRMLQHLDVVCYRNADDWLFNHDFTRSIFDKMKYYACAGYSWFGVNTINDFTMNELFLRVKEFTQTIEYAEHYFLHSRPWYCEYKIAKWINHTTSSLYRIPGREQEPGIGYIYDSSNHNPDNNRWFNRSWQLIGEHDNNERMQYYLSIRESIPYHQELEKEKHFARWLTADTWNLPDEKEEATINKKTTRNKIHPRLLQSNKHRPKQ